MRWRGEWKKIEFSIFFNDDDNENENYHPEGKHREAQSSSSLASSLERLMHHRTSDGRYLVTRKVHWMAIFRILVDRGIYPDGTDYRGFCYYMEEVFPTAEWRVPLSYQSLKGISRTMYVRPFAEWRYDAVYGISRQAYERMYRIAATLNELLECRILFEPSGIL